MPTEFGKAGGRRRIWYHFGMNTDSISRRDFLKTSTVTAGAMAITGCSSLMSPKEYGGNRIPFGVQLYSVRNDCAKDLPGTLAALGRMGYKGVEFADYFKRDAKALRRMLDESGLKCCGNHIYLDDMLGDKLSGTVEFNQTLGNSFLIVRMFPNKYTVNKASWEHAADLCSEVAEKLKPHGMRIGYHNHETEFKSLEGGMPWEIFFQRTRKEVAIQLDTANAASAGADPVLLLKKFPGRVASIHVKGFSKSKPGALVGDDELAWKDIFRLCETTAGTEWYIVEYESDLYPPLIAVEKTLDRMWQWGKC
jgi:sugar phosphate isomerase/epimerase